MSSQLRKSAKKKTLRIYEGGYRLVRTPGTKTEFLTTNSGWGTQRRQLWMVASKTSTHIFSNTKKRHSNSTWTTPLTVILTRRRGLRFSITLMCFLLLRPQSSPLQGKARLRLTQEARVSKDLSRCMEISCRSRMISLQRVWVPDSSWVLLTCF